LTLTSISGFAAEDYKIAAAPTWVQAIKPDLLTEKIPSEISNGVYYLLSDYQTKIVPQDRFQYRHFATKAINTQGMEKIGHVEIAFDPSYQHLILHSIIVHRDGKQISKLRPGIVKVLQREKN